MLRRRLRVRQGLLDREKHSRTDYAVGAAVSNVTAACGKAAKIMSVGCAGESGEGGKENFRSGHPNL